MPEDIFEYDNGVVHHHTDGKTQACEADHIDVAAKQGHHQKGANDADGDGHCNDNRTGDVTQEYDQNNNGQQSTNENIFSHQVDGAVNIAGLIIHLNNLQMPLFQNRSVHFLQNGLEAVHDHQHIGAWLPDGIHDQGCHTLVAHHHLQVFEPKPRDGDITHGYRNTVNAFDDDIGHVFCIPVFTDGAGHILPFTLIEFTGADIPVFDVQRIEEFRYGYAA